MNSLLIMHELFILMADIFIICAIIIFNKNTTLHLSSMKKNVIFAGLVLAILSLSTLQYANSLSPQQLLVIGPGALILSNTLVGFSSSKNFTRQNYFHQLISKISLIFAVSSLALGAIKISEFFLT